MGPSSAGKRTGRGHSWTARPDDPTNSHNDLLPHFKDDIPTARVLHRVQDISPIMPVDLSPCNAPAQLRPTCLRKVTRNAARSR